jgi:hypothetical protein
MADRSVNFAIYAKDAASKVFKNLQRNMFGLRGAAKQIGSDLRTIGLGIAGLTAGLIAFGISAVRGAVADAAATAKLTQALKARGMATEANLAAISDMITAGARLAYTDDEVRGSVEAATRFTKNFAAAQRISTVAMDLARTTGMTLDEATVAVGKAYQGNGSKLMTLLGVQTKDAKGKKILVKGNAALAAILSKVSGAAEAYAETTEGAFGALQISLSETKESIGTALEPAVVKLLTRLRPLLDRLTQQINDNLPQIERFATRIADKIADLAPRLVGFLERTAPKIAQWLSDGKKSLGDFGDTAEDLFGENGRLTVALAGIGAAFRGLSGAIAGALTAQGVDPITAYMVGAVSAGVISGVLSGLASTAVTAAIAKFGIQMKTASTVGGGGGGLSLPPILPTAASTAGGGGILASLGTAASTLGAGLASIGAVGAAAIAAVGVASAAAGAAIGNMQNERVARGDITREQATMEASQQGGQPMWTPAPGSAAAKEMKNDLANFFAFINPFDGGKTRADQPVSVNPMNDKYGRISAQPMNDKYSVQVYLGAESVADPLEKIIVDRVRDGGRPNNY